MGFWKWQHSFLLDVLRQFGKPSIFFTFSPYKWSFPLPKWLDVRDRVGHPPTRLAGAETYSVAHALEQIVRGYLTGCNDQRWRNHVFSYSQIPTQNNVLTYFYRFEFQKRGTIQMHLLVWLRDISEIDFERIRADVPTGNPEDAFSIRELQKSDKPSPFLNLCNEPASANRRLQSLTIQHNEEAFAVNLRAYIDTLSPTLKCSMDVQTTDGSRMLMRYTSSYVSKWSEGFDSAALSRRLEVSKKPEAVESGDVHDPCIFQGSME